MLIVGLVTHRGWIRSGRFGYLTAAAAEESAVRAAWEALGDVTACAARFDVSPTSMQWRLYSFGLHDERPDGGS